MYAMCTFYVCILCMYPIHVLYACILCIPCMYVVYECSLYSMYVLHACILLWLWHPWRPTDGTDRTEPFQIYFFFRSHFGITFLKPKWTEFSGNSVHLDPGRTGAECTQFPGNSIQLDIPIRRRGWNFPFTSPAKVQMHRIVRELCAFRTRLARVEMNRISREFRSFG